MGWSNGLAEWVEGDTTYLSVAFTWRLEDAYYRAQFAKAQGMNVIAGGPALFLVNIFVEGARVVKAAYFNGHLIVYSLALNVILMGVILWMIL